MFNIHNTELNDEQPRETGANSTRMTLSRHTERAHNTLYGRQYFMIFDIVQFV